MPDPKKKSAVLVPYTRPECDNTSAPIISYHPAYAREIRIRNKRRVKLLNTAEQNDQTPLPIPLKPGINLILYAFV